jgi:histidine phosphotransferase ChpT
MTSHRLSDLDLAALLCSRVCHDVISPVGAIANGLELMEDTDTDAEMKRIAFEMVKKSANTATAKLKFCRIAFGAAGSAGSLIDMGEAGEVAKAFVGDEKMKLEWLVPHEHRPKQEVKLLGLGDKNYDITARDGNIATFENSYHRIGNADCPVE